MSRWVLLAICLLLLPTHANAVSWTLTTRLMTGGGSLQVRDEAPLTAVSTSVMKTYTTSKIVPVKVTASNAYHVSNVTINGVSQTLPVPNPVSMGLPAFNPVVTAQTLRVSFAKNLIPVSCSATIGGTVSPAGDFTPEQESVQTFTFTPNSGKKLIAITGLPPGATIKDAVTGAIATLPYPSAVKVSFTVPATAVKMTGAFIGVIADAGAPQTVRPNTTVTLFGSATVYDGTAVSFSWVQVDGSPVTLYNATTANPSFTTSLTGGYNFRLTTTTGTGATSTSDVYVGVVDSIPAAARNRCENCHTAQGGVGGGSKVFAKWSSSRHSREMVTCPTCHVGADVGNHPGSIKLGTVSASTFTVYATGENFCIRCHSPNIPADFAQSRHGSTITCSSCHGDAHATLAFSKTAFRTFTAGSYSGRILCFRCHGGVNSTHYYSMSKIDNVCSSCHSISHNPVPTMDAQVGANHFNGYTSTVNPAYRGAYVTPRTSCTSCHVDTTGKDSYKTRREEWAASGHGDVNSPAWRSAPGTIWTRSDLCVRCHSAEGYSRFVDSGFRTAQAMTDYPDNASEPLTCNACHLPDYRVKQVPAYSMQYRYSSAAAGRTVPYSFDFSSAASSNVCIPCHTYLVAGENLKGIQANMASGSAPAGFWDSTPFIGPHQNGGAANVYAAAGYHFSGQEYGGNANHTTVASGTDGSCIGCHMDRSDHSFQARSGAICSSCHGAGMTDQFLAAQKAQFAALKRALQLQLSSVKGVKYNRSVSGYFFTSQGSASASPNLFTSWGNVDTMGAAFNLYLLDHDPGAFAHNPSYARRLLRDSLDFVANGSVDRSRDVFANVSSQLRRQGYDDTTLGGVRDILSPAGTGASGYCANCHRPMLVSGTIFGNNTAHFRQATGYASYTNIYDCSACHSPHAAGSPIPLPDEPYGSFASEGHAAYRSPVWTGNQQIAAGGDEVNAPATSCARCHNPQVMQSFVSGDAGHAPYTHTTAAAGTSVVSCASCHSSLNTSSNSAEVTRLPAVKVYYNVSSALTKKIKVSHSYPDAANSNVCVVCHSGTVSGETVAALATRFGNLSGYPGAPLATHALPVALTLYGNAYNGTGYVSPMLAHDRVGLTVNGSSTTGTGPCAACHNLKSASHSFAAVATDGSGAVTAINNPTLCGGCHKNGLEAAAVSSAKRKFQDSLAVLAQLLIDKGYISSYRYGGAIPQPNLAGKWGSSARFGAWFNIDLLTRDGSQRNDPAAYVHNPAYARKMIYDAIDLFDDGKANGSAVATIAATTINPAKITGAPGTATSIKSSAVEYLGNDRAGCNSCHLESSDPETGKNIIAAYNDSPHPGAPNGPTCADCHAPNPPVAHPGSPMNTSMSEVSARCDACHPKIHTWRSVGICTQCHNGHSPEDVELGYPHLSNYSTAQYLATNFSCDSCHVENDGKDKLTFHIYTASFYWARSGKGNVKSPSYIAYDFKTMGTTGASPETSAATDCVRCHTNTGYVNYVTSGFRNISAWGVSGAVAGGDDTRETISCPTCHSPTPFFSEPRYDEKNDTIIPPYSRRKVGRVTAYYNYSSAASGKVLASSAIFGDAGSSNNCIVCHSGRVSGSTLKRIAENVGDVSAQYWSDAPFLDPHGMGAAGILYQTTGYMFNHYLKDYSAAPLPGHPGIGGFEEGACVACHMLSDDAHLFQAVRKNTTGNITRINAFQGLCYKCHDRTSAVEPLNDPASLDAKRIDYRSSLKALAAVLAGKGIHFNAELAPYFFSEKDPALQGATNRYRNWNALNSAGNLYTGMDTMGSAFNLRLLWADAGAYTHNDIYAKRLLYDSIDYLDNGLLDASVFKTIQNGDWFVLDDADRTNALRYVGGRP